MPIIGIAESESTAAIAATNSNLFISRPQKVFQQVRQHLSIICKLQLDQLLTQ
jgi:hypothetical protein